MRERWWVAVVKARYFVLGAWLLVAVLGLLSASSLNGLLTTPLAVPGTPSATANQILQQHFGENVAGTFTVVMPVGSASSETVSSDKASIRRAAQTLPHGRVIEQQELIGVLVAFINTSLDLKSAAPQTSTLRHALAARDLHGALVTGPPALQHDVTPVLVSDLHRGELIAAGVAIVILLLLFGLCWAISVPLLVAAATIAVDIGVVLVLAHLTTMVLYIPNVIELIGLGLAVDYSLLIVHRFRHELANSAITVEQAVLNTMARAGRTVVISGGVVAIGLAVLSVVPVPFLRSLGLAGLVVPVVAVLAALTLQPALLAIMGRRGFRAAGAKAHPTRSDSRHWKRFAATVVSRPVTTLVGALVVLLACGTSVWWLQLTPGSTSALPAQLASVRALSIIGPGMLAPDQIVIDLGGAHRASEPSAKSATKSLVKAINQDPEAFITASGHSSPFTDSTGRYEQIDVFGRDQLGAPAAQQFVQRLRDRYVPHSHFGSSTQIYVGGAPAQGVDFLHTVYAEFPWIVLLALALSFIVLARAFRSLVLAAVSVVLNLLSVTAAFGLLVVAFRFGVGRFLFGTYQVNQIDGWVPIFLFAVLFGLSMDYEVFLVSRMREAHDSGLSSTESIVAGVARTGGVISAAAVILVGAMVGLIIGHVAGLQELGVGLAVGILVDATVVRGLLLPSVMTLCGRWNWWLPDGAARLLRTTPSPLELPGARA
jgi:RND superfamily putative drug exporter